MNSQTLRGRALAFVAGVALLAFSGWACADPPARVARLAYTSGAVSFSPAGQSDWDRATLNRPMGAGDRLWTDRAARAEIQVGAALIRMDGETSVAVLNLDDRIVQLQLTQGTLNVRVRRLAPGQSVEVDTPNLAFTLRRPGDYRIAVDPDGQATDIVVRKGQGEAYGDGAAYVIDASQPYRFTGTGLREYEYLPLPPLDEFDRWARRRDQRYDNSRSARYVAPDVIGYQDLDANGTWRVEPNYGNVWIPNRVASDWAPYRDGHWTWIDPWGWTWVDDAPWGFAVTHYGRWAHIRGTWGWIPGPVRAPAYYAPALVVFLSGSNFQLSISSGPVGGVGWFPLAPREIYRPSYPVSRSYFERVNSGNTVLNRTVINNTYNSYSTTNITNITNVVYANRAVPGAVVAVPTTVFMRSQPVARAALPVPREQLARAPAAHVALVAPTEQSVRGAAPSGDKPPPRVFERPVVARSAPAAPHVGLAAQREQLTAKPVPPATSAVPQEPRARSGVRRNDEQRGQAPVPPVLLPRAPEPIPAPAAPTTLPQVAPPPVVPAPVLRPSEPRGRSLQRRDDEQRGAQAVVPPAAVPSAPAPRAVSPRPVPPPAPLQRAPEPRPLPLPAAPAAVVPQVVPPPVAPAPAARPSEPRGRSLQRRDDQQRSQTVAPPVLPQAVVPPPAAPKPVVPPPVAAPVPVPPPVRLVPPPPKPEPAPVVRPLEAPRPPVAVPKPPPPQLPVPAQAAPKAEPKAEPKANGPRPAASRPLSAASRAVERENERKRVEGERSQSR
jgi:hypothetical protein